jgi:hypothetical protein
LRFLRGPPTHAENPRPPHQTTLARSAGALAEAIRAGNFYEAACGYAGIDYATFRRWMERGERESRGAYRALRDAIEKAEAVAEVTVVAQWRSQIPTSWQAARDFLARRFPSRWRPVERFEHSGPDGGPIDIAALIQRAHENRAQREQGGDDRDP